MVCKGMPTVHIQAWISYNNKSLYYIVGGVVNDNKNIDRMFGIRSAARSHLYGRL